MLVNNWESYLSIFIGFTIFFAHLRENGYPTALEYIENKKIRVEDEMNSISSFDFFTFKKFHTKMHEIDRLKSRVNTYITCSKMSCIGIIIFSLIGIFQVILINLFNYQNLIVATLLVFNILFWISTTSIPGISSILPKR